MPPDRCRPGPGSEVRCLDPRALQILKLNASVASQAGAVCHLGNAGPR